MNSQTDSHIHHGGMTGSIVGTIAGPQAISLRSYSGIPSPSPCPWFTKDRARKTGVIYIDPQGTDAIKQWKTPVGLEESVPSAGRKTLPVLGSQTIYEISFETGKIAPKSIMAVTMSCLAFDAALESRSHNAGIEPNKSANGNRDSLLPEGLLLPGILKRRPNRTTKQLCMPMLDSPAHYDVIKSET